MIFKIKKTKGQFFFFFFFAGLLSVGFSQRADASHAAGAEITYSLVPNTTNTYTVTYRFYRYCTGASAPNTVSLCYWNNCQTGTNTLVLPKIFGPNIVGSGCPNFPNNCIDPNSVVPGYEEHVYQSQVTLPIQCNSWHFSASITARNPMPWMGGGNLFVETTFDNTVSQNDDSPYFSLPPVPYCCVNTPFTYNMGTIDVDGDSLFFESINPLNGACGTSSPTPVPIPASFPGVYSAITNPIPCNNSFVLNSQTGSMSFTPSNVGTGVITIRCSAFRNGQLISTIMRDIQVVVLNCSPAIISPPDIDTNTLVNVGIDSLGQLKACSGDSIQFCFGISSPDTASILVASSNISVSLPGATISYSGLLTDSIQACVNWQTTAADTGLHVLVITVIDSNCVPPGILIPFSFTIPVFIDYGIQAFGDTVICAGDQTQLFATGGGDKNWSVLPGGSPITSLSCTNCDNPIASPTLPTYYVVEGCDLDTVFVDVVQVPSLVVTPRTTTCVNSSLQLDVAANPGPPAQQYDYSWTPGTFLTSTTIRNPVCELPNPAGNSITYTVNVTPKNGGGTSIPGCSATASVIVDVLKGFTIDPYDTILCDGESTTITGTGTTAGLTPDAYNFNWTPPGDMTPNNTLNTTITPAVPGGMYTITASFPGCPDSSVTLPVIVDALPVVDAGIDREMCLNDTIHLNSSVLPDSQNYYTITWTPGADMNNSTIPNPVYSGKITQNLNVTYTTPNGCSDDDNVLITVNNVDFLQLDGDRAICPGDTTGLSVIGGISYGWSPDYFISSTGNVSSVQVYPEATQEYQVIGLDANGCYDTAYANVVVYPNSVLDAGDDVTIYPGESVTLYADGNVTLFNWFPPSGLSSTTIKNPNAQPTATTRYYVNAQTENGCPTMDSVTVIVSNESLIDLPNAFSPGSGTSINDKLTIKRRGLVELKTWNIYNRWGERVFNTTDINDGWDGRFNDKPQPLGTYVYVIEAVTSTGKRFYKQGNVTLVR